DVAKRVAEMREKEREARASQPGDLSAEIVDAVGSIIRGQYDPQFGGFGREPKFPQPKILRFLLDEHRRHGYPELATMLHKTVGAYFAGSQDADEHYYSLEAAERAKHGAPYVDRTLYASWNELAASAYWAAFNALGDARLDERAQAVVRTVGTRLWDREAKSL